jgi:hypothetical protein
MRLPTGSALRAYPLASLVGDAKIDFVPAKMTASSTT